ncbi:MAG: ribonuclease H-like domain-containing protein [Clostridia bacterium]|nr:ribonuclease H-like domain-containing protein [Clostridia bacterium]
MISNLQKKLAAISKEMQSSAENAPHADELDFSCSVYENSYDTDYSVGNIKINSLLTQDANILADICFAEHDEKINISDILFFDTETTGLGTGASILAFLIGVGYFESDKFILKQFLMNDYHQESSILKNFNDLLARHRAIVSYNGKSYDTHIVNSRSIINSLPRMMEGKTQLDLLHSARRLYKRRLESCSLSSLEKEILGIHRIDDIPGSEIPEIFFNYIKYKDKSMLEKVIEHNRQDILSMVGVASKLIDAFDNGEALGHREDIFSQGMIFEKLNFPQKAILCYNVLGNYPPALHRLGHIAKADMKYAEAIEHFSTLSKLQKFDFSADIELAKIYEHKMNDCLKAIEHTNRALEKADSFLSSASKDAMDEIKKRKHRLSEKLKKQ